MASGEFRPLFCNVCQVSLSGRIPAKQHYRSAGHLKKEENSKQASLGLYYCNVCNIQCNTHRILEQHILSPKHQAIEKKQREAATRVSHLEASHATSTASAREYVFDGNRGYCFVCKLDLTSSSHAQSHLSGSKHSKRKSQVEMSQNSPLVQTKEHAVNKGMIGQSGMDVDSSKDNVGESYYQYCNLCKVPFSGPESARQHYSSEKHRKKESLTIKEERGELLPLICDVCDCSFTGQENSKAHFDSPKHARNLQNKTIQTRSKSGMIFPSLNQPLNNGDFGHGKASNVHEIDKGHVREVEAIPEMEWQGIGKVISSNEPQFRDFQQLTKAKVPADTNDGDSIIKPFPAEGKNTASETNNVQIIQDTDKKGSLKVESDSNTKGFEMRKGEVTEEKIKDELLSSPVLESSIYSKLSSIDMSSPDSFSKSDEPVRYIQNNLKPAIPSFGRGKLFWELKNSNAVVGQLLNMEKNNGSVDATLVKLEQYKQDMKEADVGRKGNTGIPQTLTAFDASSCYRHGFHDNSNDTSSPRILHDSKQNLTDQEKRQVKMNYGSSTNESVDLRGSQQIGSAVRETDEERDRIYSYDPGTQRGRCYLCNIELTSFKHMSQHINGKNHVKAVQVHEQMQTMSMAVGASLACNLCLVTFTGPEARDQHNRSERHLTKVRGVEPSYFCEVCKISCSGEISHQQHLMGAQHKKKAGLSEAFVNLPLGMSADRTTWYHCDVCGCALNSSQQLAIHRNSHFSKAAQQHVGNFSSDKTEWYTCNICNCNLNSVAQLQIHEQSPAHLSKLQRSGHQNIETLHTSMPPSALSDSNVSNVNALFDPNSMDRMDLTPLESFLSQELFPEEFMPKIEKSDSEEPMIKPQEPVTRSEPSNKTPFNLVVSGSPVPFGEKAAIVVSTEQAMTDCDTTGAGGAKRGQGSDLAWATRNRGTRENSRVVMNRDKSQNYDVNPYASTHRFYCHTCKTPMNTQESYEAHLRGKRHLQKVCTEPAPVREHCIPFALPQDYVPKVATTPRNYQMELYHKAMEHDALCFLPTGTGKTLVSVLMISAMLEKYPSRNALFLVDKVLLVLQQSQYIRKELQDKKFIRYNPDSPDQELCNRHIQIAAMCMGQQNTNGVPLWKHDIVVVTAAFCKNLMDKSILRWDDFSIVVFDEAHHCDKSHPFNSLLQSYHAQTPESQHRPKVLGLTASPAGKADVPRTVQMLESLIMNMGGVTMTVVEGTENVRTLREFQSNAKMVIKSQGREMYFDDRTIYCRHELNVYLLQCYLHMRQISDIQNYLCPKGVSLNMGISEMGRIADEFVEINFDVFQSSLACLSSTVLEKVEFSLLVSHVSSVCMTLSSLMEGGILAMLEEVIEMQATQYDFDFAKKLGLPCDTLVNLIQNQGLEDQFVQRNSPDQRTNELIAVLTDKSCGNFDRSRSISLVLVKERGTAHRLTRILQNDTKLKQMGLHTATVVGHGGSGAAEKGMTVSQQKRILEEIKQFKYQIIIATSVAEEGVDWPECERVICMYPPSTVTALVQMRGRARKKNSLFIVLCASEQEEEKLRDIMNREQNMIQATQILVAKGRQSATS